MLVQHTWTMVDPEAISLQSHPGSDTLAIRELNADGVALLFFEAQCAGTCPPDESIGL